MKSLVNFNSELTLEEALELYKFKGQINYMKTKHNVLIMAKVIDLHLKDLSK